MFSSLHHDVDQFITFSLLLVHLLNLHSTSIWAITTMDLYILNVDEGDLESIVEPGFSAKRRVVHSEEIGKLASLS